MSEANLVLVGPMGSGKSSVGAQVAARLGRPFVDLDREVERLSGRSVRALFREQGEAAFRRLEAEVCRRHAAPGGSVIATGGGTLEAPGNLAALAAGGRLVWLRAAHATLWGRVAAAPPRPLLERLPPAARPERLAALARARTPRYREATLEVDADAPLAEVASELARLVASPLGSARCVLQVVGSARCPVYVGEGLRGQVGAALTVAGFAPGPVVLVSDPRVGELHGARTLAGLRAAGFAPRSVVVPRGEAAKTAAQLSALWEGLLEAGVQRDTPVVALGGGAASDAIGFAAATLLRGVPWVAVPTTLLGMVDAGLGGKTAIDLPQGKNLAGAFAPPRAVLLDPECLATLPPGTPPGMAEVLKHALIADPALWSELGRRAGRGDPRRALGADLLLRSARVKLDCVAEDPFDRGVRRTLNLGHTFAHGLERAADYALSHGHAVAVGLVAAAAVSEAQGYAEPGLRAEIEAGLERWGLPTRFPARWLPAAAEALRRDKKARGEQVEAILLHEVGCAARAWLPFEALEDGLERVAYSGNSMSRSDATPVLAASPERSSRSPTAPRLAKP